MTLPFGDYDDVKNRGWRLMEDGHAGLIEGGNMSLIRLVWGGETRETFEKVGNRY